MDVETVIYNFIIKPLCEVYIIILYLTMEIVERKKIVFIIMCPVSLQFLNVQNGTQISMLRNLSKYI